MTLKLPPATPLAALSNSAITVANLASLHMWTQCVQSADRAVQVSLQTPLGPEGDQQMKLLMSGQAAFDRLMILLEPQLRELAMIRTGGTLIVDATVQPAQGDDLTLRLMLGETPFDQGQLVHVHLRAG